MNINPLIPLAYNIADFKKRYVLFCGSGVSIDAGVPTGWDVLIETIRIIRQQEDGKNNNYTTEDLEKYYEKKYKGKTYPEIIGSIFPSNEEQRDFLSKFFDGKTPGKTHQLIAEWVEKGLIRFVITTNFDSLIEYALDEKGLRGKYSVISSGAQVLTSKPWIQEDICRIYKLHGTIEQGKIRNTKKDLKVIDKDLEKDFLDIIERHGLIILGYHGHDEAVMDGFNKRRFKGYTLFWCNYIHNEPLKEVETLVNKQDGRLVGIESASSFLEEVLDRVDIAVKGIEQSDSAIAQVRIKKLSATKGAAIEIRQEIDEEKRKLTKYIASLVEEFESSNHEVLWNGVIQVYNYSKEFLLFSEQVIKYHEGFHKQIFSVLDSIYSINKTESRHGVDGFVNYCFFFLFEVLGAILIENERYTLIKKLLETRRLNSRKDGFDNILDWNVQCDFVEEKKGYDTNKWIVPRMHYLIQMIESQENPFEFDLKNKLIETDLLYFVYSIHKVEGGIPWFWYPQTAAYCGRGSPEFFKLIKLDKKFGELVASQIFDMPYDELITLLNKTRTIFQDKCSDMIFNSMSHAFEEFT